ncbi:hypothetical protein vseg_021661 [Gypsophila vaccaria]
MITHVITTTTHKGPPKSDSERSLELKHASNGMRENTDWKSGGAVNYEKEAANNELIRSMWQEYYYYCYHYYWSAYYPNIVNQPLDCWDCPSSYGPYYPTYWSPQYPVQIDPQSFFLGYCSQEFPYFVVIDFEATCDKEKNPHPQEIIEFPSVIVNSRTGQLEDCFQMYVRPTHNQLLTEFCKDLTGIQQSQVDKGVSLSEALLAHDKWLEGKGVKDNNFAVVTWSNWDCRVMLESECQFKKIKKPSYFNRWINLKIPFGEVFGGGKYNLKEAVERAGLTWEGRAHCGLDDAKNTARLLTHIISSGIKLSITDTLPWQPDDDPPKSSPTTLPHKTIVPQKPKEAASAKNCTHEYCFHGTVSKKPVLQKTDQLKRAPPKTDPVKASS